MTDTPATLSTLFSQLSKVFKPMVPDQVTEIVSGSAKIVVLPPGYEIVEPLPKLSQILRELRRLSPEEAEDLAEGRLQFKIVPKGSKVVAPWDVAEEAAAIRQLAIAPEIVRALSGDSRLTMARLRQLADELNVPVLPTIRTKAALQLHIAETLAAYRARNPN